MARFNRSTRRGATLVEAAIIIPVFLLLALGTVDVGLAVLRYNTLSQGARQGARTAMVHGVDAPAGWNGGRWGTTTIDQDLTADGVPAVDAVKTMLSTMPPDRTRVQVEWPNGSDNIGDPVRVTVTSEYEPISTWIFGGSTITLHATSTMPIAH